MKKKTTLGQRIRAERERLGLTQRGLAIVIGVKSRSPMVISKWETDQAEPSVEKINRLCKLFEISADLLLGTDTKKRLISA